MARWNAGFLGLLGGQNGGLPVVVIFIFFYLTLEDIIAVNQQCVDADKRLETCCFAKCPFCLTTISIFMFMPMDLCSSQLLSVKFLFAEDNGAVLRVSHQD